MKNYQYLILSLCLLSFNCSKEEQNCLGAASEIVQKEIVVAYFNEFIVNDYIEVFLKDSTAQKITIKTEKNLLSKIELKITDNQLEIINLNECLFFKDLSSTKIYITSPNIKKIRNSSRYSVHSLGILKYPVIDLITENYLSDYLNAGNFDLEVDSEKINIVANGPSNNTIKGNVDFLNINYAGSNPRFNGENLEIKDATLFARSTNDILINVTNSVSGDLYSTGNVILLKKPNLINLTAHYKGKVETRY